MQTSLSYKTLRTQVPGKSQQSVVLHLVGRLSEWDAELNFYHRLLTWSLLSCKEEDRPEIEALLVRIDRLRNVDLPALRAQVELARMALSPTFTHFRAEFMSLRTRSDYFDQKLRDCKSSIFKGLSHLIRVEIW